MASLITCTPGGASDNSHIELEDADAYFANTTRVDTWLAYSDADRERALIEATAQIEALGGPRAADSAHRPRFAGSPYNVNLSDQCLFFPRTRDVDDDGTVVIPEAIQRAVCEQAYWLRTNVTNPALVDFADLRAEGVSIFNMDGVYIQMNGRGPSRPSHICPLAWAAVKPYLRVGAGLATGNGPARHLSSTRRGY